MDDLEQQMEQFVENVRQLGIIVTDFQPQNGQQTLNQKINQIVTSLKEIDKLRGTIANVQLPIEVFDYIDSGKNPQFYTKDYMEKALVKNEEVKGKIDHYKRFKSILIEELTKVFPSEMNKYHTFRPNEQ